MPKAKILIVEDDKHLLNGIREILQLEDYRVVTAENGKKALVALSNDPVPPDLIVSDIMMPVMDGIELLKQLRTEARWISLPVIFLTAKSEKTDIQRGKRMGVDDYLLKPFDAEDLLVAIESRLERHRALNTIHSTAMADLKRSILMILNHEFRTPLTLVVAYADMLNDEASGEMTREEIGSFLLGINSGAERLRRLVENFILLVELEMGESHKTFNWRKAPVSDVEFLLKTAVKLVKRNPKVTHNITVDVKNPVPVFIADTEYLQNALIQIIDNAVKFSTADKPIIVGAHADKDVVHLWVKDEGRGIHAKNLDDIWNTFHQADRGQFEDQGAGSGLAIVRGVITLHGGRVDVKSERGQGSTFTMILPIAQEQIVPVLKEETKL